MFGVLGGVLVLILSSVFLDCLRCFEERFKLTSLGLRRFFLTVLISPLAASCRLGAGQGCNCATPFDLFAEGPKQSRPPEVVFRHF